MGMRITTSMMMNTYRFNLQNSTGTLNDTRNKVMSQRKFMSYAEDPAAATQAWRIRRAMSNNADYQANNADTNSRFNIAWTTMGVVNHDLLDLAGRYSTIRGESDGTASGRRPLGQVMSQTAETIIQALNGAKYGDHYVFSGDDEMNPPFSWNEDKTILYYRGVNVGAGKVEMPNKPAWAYNAINPETGMPYGIPSDKFANIPEDQPLSDEQAWEKAWVEYYEDQAQKRPSWTYNQPDADGLPKGMPQKSDDPTEQAWIDYYNDLVKTPDWVDGEKDENGMLLEMPEEEPADEAGKAWYKYYTDLEASIKAQNAYDEVTSKLDRYDELLARSGDPDFDDADQAELADLENQKADLDAQKTALEEEMAGYQNLTPWEHPVDKPENAAGIQEPEAVPAWTQEKPPVPPANPSAWDTKWINYLEKGGNKPAAPDYAPKDWGNPDKYGIPEKVKSILANPEASNYEKAWADYYVDQADVLRLKELAGETQFVDLGMGLREDSPGNLVNGTAFDRSLPGIEMLGGYGYDEDGDPRNAVLIMKRLGELLSACDEETGAWGNKGDGEEALRLMDKLNAAYGRTSEAFSHIDTQGQFLQSNQDVLETQGFYLQEERYNLENLDPADAITEFMWAYNCYSAALKIGTQLLSQSLIDYMT